MPYCPNCNNIYDITKKIEKENKETETNTNTEENTDNLTTEQKGEENVDKLTDELKAYFICKNCGNSEQIKLGTTLFTKNYNNVIKTNINTNNVKNYKEVSYYPRTREYMCPNNKCVTHNDHTKREAVFFRVENTYKVTYVCTACDTHF
jgi:hypothetical protein